MCVRGCVTLVGGVYVCLTMCNGVCAYMCPLCLFMSLCECVNYVFFITVCMSVCLCEGVLLCMFM